MNFEFQYYPGNVKIPKPLGVTDLKYLCSAIGNPSEAMRKIYNDIAAAEAKGDMKKKAELKQNNLYYCTPCVLTNGKGRKYDNIESFTGLLVLDFDHIQNSEAFKRFMFHKYKSIICAFLSPSKKGVKFIVRIPVVSTVDEFKSYYFGIAHEMEKYNGWDGSGQNCILPLFLSWDEEILVREDFETWTIKGKKYNAFEGVPVDGAQKLEIEIGEGDKARILQNIKTAFELIVDNGHPQLRAACVSLGGYVAAGYLQQIEAEEFVSNIIRVHPYLKKGVSGYIKTAKTAINKGMQSPIKLESNE